jgi:glycosyltransferase involved in cell wall biosynthesis
VLRDVPRRRILVLSPRDPYPVIGGDRLRIHRMARELARHHDLTLVTFCGSQAETVAPLADDGVFKEVHRIVLPAWRSWLNTAAALLSSEPLQVAYYRSPEFREVVQRLAPAHDAVVAHLIRTADYVRGLPTLRVLDMCDALSMNMDRVARTRGEHLDVRRFLYRIEAKRLLAHERSVANDFDLVTLISPVDARFVFASAPHRARNVMIVPNGADIPTRTPPPQARRLRNEIAFVGNLHTLQNFDGLWFFARNVLPLVRQVRPDAVLRVIGKLRSTARRRLSALPGVRVEGFVPNLGAALATARIGVCPVRLGSGVKNKVLDYFANRLAVISSSCGLEGLEARANEHLLVADSVEEWAGQVTRLLDDDLAAQRLADAGRELVSKRYHWDDCVDPLVVRLNMLFAAQRADQDALDEAAENHALRA